MNLGVWLVFALKHTFLHDLIYIECLSAKCITHQEVVYFVRKVRWEERRSLTSRIWFQPQSHTDWLIAYAEIHTHLHKYTHRQTWGHAELSFLFSQQHLQNTHASQIIYGNLHIFRKLNNIVSCLPSDSRITSSYFKIFIHMPFIGHVRTERTKQDVRRRSNWQIAIWEKLASIADRLKYVNLFIYVSMS